MQVAALVQNDQVDEGSILPWDETAPGISAFGLLPVREIAGFRHPESVCQQGQWLYVSEIGAEMEPLKKDGDGAICKVDLATGRIVDRHFLPAEGVLHAPKGLALDGETLYVTDIDRVLGFNVRTRKKVLDCPIAETGFLNDPVMGDGVLYVSATDNGQIYAIDPLTGHYKALPLSDSVRGANGLFYDHVRKSLYCVAIGSMANPSGLIYSIDPSNGAVKVLSDYRGLLDGVAVSGSVLYFSDWKGFKGPGGLLALDLTTGKVRELGSVGAIFGPADFILSEDGHSFIIPSMVAGKVSIRAVP